MTPLVQRAPRLSVDDAVGFARDLYGMAATAEPLPSERDQNFRLQSADGARFVLKIANAEESRDIVDLQIKAIQHLAPIATELAWPRIVRTLSGGEIAQSGGRCGRRRTIRVWKRYRITRTGRSGRRGTG
jgi:Ser/Thr protein kinase RdoA (MazF antagonist)